MTHSTSYTNRSAGRPAIQAQSSEQAAHQAANRRADRGAANAKGRATTPCAVEASAAEACGEEADGLVVAGVRQDVRRPMVLRDELAYLARRYGPPRRLLYSIQADAYIYSYRWRKDSDRRAEVVFAIQDPVGHVWVHAKPHYPAHIFRLPSGGVHWNEEIETALLREVQEETGLTVRIEQFLGLLEYTFVHGGSTVEFASYVFHLHSTGGEPVAREGETISEFRPIQPGRLSEVAVDLRNLIGDRRGWGQWRALAHDLVFESLTNQSLSSKGSFVC